MDVGLVKSSDGGIFGGTTGVNDGSGAEGTIVSRASSLVDVSEGIIVSCSLVEGEGEV